MSFEPQMTIWALFVFLLITLLIQPIFLYSNTSCIDGTPLSKAFLDPAPIMTSIFCSILVCSTTALELILDILFKSELSKVKDKFERFMLFLIVIIPGVSILKAAHTPEIASIFCSWHMFHFVGSLAPVYSICCKFVPDYFGGIQLPLSYSFWVLAGVFSLRSVRGPLGRWSLIIVAGLGVLSQMIFLSAIYRWGKSLQGRAKSKKLRFPICLAFNVMEIMSEDEFCCALYVLFGLPFYTGFASLAGSIQFSWSNCNQDEILSGVYIFICFTLLTSCIPGRAKQYASIIQEKKIDAGHATIRYISHEIRSPLNIVQNGSKLLIRELHGKCSEDVLENLLDVQHASDAATVIVDDLLDFEKIQSGKFVLSQKFVPVSTCVTKIAESCRSLARLKGIHFFVHDSIPQHQDLIHTAHIDVFKLEQVIRNLITNSIKFTQAGGSISVYVRHITDFLTTCSELRGNDDRNSSKIQNFLTSNRVFKAIGWCCHGFVRLGTQKQVCSRVYATSQNVRSSNVQAPLEHSQSKKCKDDNDGCIIIEVVDTGVGMSSEQTANVFGEFVQFDANRLQGGGGSGLGLWICKEIINAHGGSISVHSEGEGNGTKVSLKLHCYLRKNADVEVGGNCDLSSVYSVQHPKSEAKLQCEGSKFASALSYDIDSRSIQGCPPAFCYEEEKSLLDTAHINKISKSITTAKLCLLIVDDSALNRKILIKTIKSLQDSLPNGVVLNFLEADNGTSALQLMKSNSECTFDAVFMDNIMPKMNGPRAAEAMRNELNFKGRIIGVTGNGLDSDILDFKMHGANEVLIKPVCWAALKNELEMLLGPSHK